MTRTALIHEWDQDYDRYPLPFCLDPLTEKLELGRRRQWIEQDVDEFLLTKQNTSMDSSKSVMKQPHTAKLSVQQLAESLYEGTPHLQNLAEKLARQHGQECEALTFFHMMGDDIKNFYMGIAQQLIDHAKEWRKNEGSACILSPEETKRLAELPRHPEPQPGKAADVPDNHVGDIEKVPRWVKASERLPIGEVYARLFGKKGILSIHEDCATFHGETPHNSKGSGHVYLFSDPQLYQIEWLDETDGPQVRMPLEENLDTIIEHIWQSAECRTGNAPDTFRAGAIGMYHFTANEHPAVMYWFHKFMTAAGAQGSVNPPNSPSNP